jgi:hypothetical protein
MGEMMTPKNERQVLVSRVNVAEALALRIGDNGALLGLLRTVLDGHAESGTPLPGPFDGQDATAKIPVLLMEALLQNQKLLLEVSTNLGEARKEDRSPYQQVLGESKLRELDVILRQAIAVSIEAHLFLHRMG